MRCADTVRNIVAGVGDEQPKVGVSESCLSRWLRIADREDGIGTDTVDGPPPNPPGDLEAENRELRQRTKRLEQENEILRRATAYFARDVLPK